MPDPNPTALEFLLTRRSRPAKTLTAPWPARDDLMPILTAGARSPDHGKLEPWRFIVLEGAALGRLGALAQARGEALGMEPEKSAKVAASFNDSGLCIAVIASPVDSPKVPLIEQHLSAGAVCLAILNAALASGWGANWLTGFVAMDPDFLSGGLGLADSEFVAGFIHIGTERMAPPDRPRPDLNAKTTWVKA